MTLAVGGTVGQRVAQVVHAVGSTVAIVEDDPARAAELIARGLQVITGNACAPGPSPPGISAVKSSSRGRTSAISWSITPA